MMADLLMTYGDEVTLYKHQGYSGGDDFWQEDQGWEEEGENYTVLIENELSEETLSQAGFSDEAEAAMWFDENVVEKGDKIKHIDNEFIAISVSNFHAAGEFARQIIGVRHHNA